MSCRFNASGDITFYSLANYIFISVKRHFLDLKAVNANGTHYDYLMWGDGTQLDSSILLGNGVEPVKNSENAENMGMWNGKVDDYGNNGIASCLCQNI